MERDLSTSAGAKDWYEVLLTKDERFAEMNV
jgi:hypothetical protein